MVFAFAFYLNAEAQSHVFCETVTNKSSVYVGEPIELSVFVYTSTWFTKGVNPGNIKINGAFTIYFRSVSQSKQIKGKTYAGVQMIYNVFPYDDSDLIIPEIEINVESPDEGGYKGIKRSVKTKAKKIEVKAIPASINSEQWLVADNLTLDENWIGNIKNVKVGDVIERQISISVYGTVSELIPPIEWDSIIGVSNYPNRAEIKSNKTKTSISATRNESNRFLFEKEGIILIPEIVFSWWNPTKNKLFKRSLKAVSINVLPNPNLGIIESIKDSLAIENADGTNETIDDAEFKILSYSIKEFAIGIIAISIIAFLLFKFSLMLIKWKKKRHQQYLNSENYYFDQFIKNSHKNISSSTINSLYLWISMLDFNPKTLANFNANYGNKILKKDIEKIENLLKTELENDISINTNEWKQSRRKYLRSKKDKNNSSHSSVLNPLFN
jgi:hypothetical protein